MNEVKVVIQNQDRKIGAMVKALAVEVSGFQAVKGTTKDYLARHGFYVFHFPSDVKAEEFKESVLTYIDSKFVTIDI
jgi:hypothetical protein